VILLKSIIYLIAGTGSNNYVTMSGTSSSSFVSGTIALVLSLDPSATFDQVLTLLQNTAYQPEISGHQDYCGPGPDDYPNNGYGYGIVDAGTALGVK
jgi:subtilisin family serine protease